VKKAAKKEAKAEKVKDAVKANDEAVGKTNDGKVVFAGSKGGHYYLNDKGDKTYVKDFVGAKIIGQTKDGKSIYEGPRGGHYYYNDKGDKVYVKK
jgi:colicin import membrane protein